MTLWLVVIVYGIGVVLCDYWLWRTTRITTVIGLGCGLAWPVILELALLDGSIRWELPKPPQRKRTKDELEAELAALDKAVAAIKVVQP